MTPVNPEGPLRVPDPHFEHHLVHHVLLLTVGCSDRNKKRKQKPDKQKTENTEQLHKLSVRGRSVRPRRNKNKNTSSVSHWPPPPLRFVFLPHLFCSRTCSCCCFFFQILRKVTVVGAFFWSRLSVAGPFYSQPTDKYQFDWIRPGMRTQKLY